MTKLLDHALESAWRLPSAMQDNVARVILSFAVKMGRSYSTLEEGEALALSEAADKSAGVKITRHSPGRGPHKGG